MEVATVSSAPDETGALTITHKEYIQDVFGPSTTTSFVNSSFKLNPGLMASFPWLSQIASNFEEYEWISMIWSFRSTLTDIGNSSNGQVGTIVMVTNYDPDEDAFVDKQTMMQYDASMSTKATEHQIHGVECDPGKLSGTAGKYVRSGDIPANEELKTYDLGTFQIAVCNCPSTLNAQQLGELWVSYTVRLRKPKSFFNKGLGLLRDEFQTTADTGVNNVLGITNAAAQLPTPVARAYSNNLGTTWLRVGGQDNKYRVTFPDNLSGLIEIVLKFTSSDNTKPNNLTVLGVDGTTYGATGNVKLIEDIWACADAADTPASVDFINNNNEFVSMVKVFVTPSTAGARNTIVLQLTGHSGTASNIRNAYLSFTMINPYFIYQRDSSTRWYNMVTNAEQTYT